MRSIAQYDVCPVFGLRAGSVVELAVVLQHDQLADMATRIVAPLLDVEADFDLDRLTPRVEIDGDRYLVAIHLLTTLPVRNLGRPIASLQEYEQQLKLAIDFLLFGV